ncbi:MAG TPA: hypothetical protein DCL35_05745 [Candidatus Omnitrophica bacterium]|nr:hypothetical protein [Candidatus Omnitrophota bacterium]
MKKTAEKFIFGVLVFCTGVLLLSPGAVAGKGRGPGDYDFLLGHGGLERTYRAHVPQSYDAQRPVPLVLAFHGGGGNIEAASRYFRLDEKSDEEGFIVVYPQGTGKRIAGMLFGTWNAGRCCKPAMANNVDDVGFVRKMVAKLKKDFVIDEKRIYMTGFSNGGQMVFRLACEMPGVFAAAAPAGSVGTFDNCTPRRPIPIFHFDGTADPCSPYEGGGECGGCFGKFFRSIGVPVKDINYYACDPVPVYIEKWRKWNGCDDTPKVTMRQGDTTCITYSPCKGNVEVTSCVTKGGGHAWAGNVEYEAQACRSRPQGYICRQWKNAIGPLILDYDATDTIWEFFKKYALDEGK